MTAMIEHHNTTHGRARARWAAIGAAVAVSLGAGGLGIANAAIDSGAKPVTITVSPERVLDTRANLGLAGAFSDAAPRDLVLTGNIAVAPSGTKTVVPADATGAIVNVTIVNPSGPGFLRPVRRPRARSTSRRPAPSFRTPRRSPWAPEDRSRSGSRSPAASAPRTY
jgi:hypothetical protein